MWCHHTWLIIRYLILRNCVNFIMIERNIYNDGLLVVTKCRGKISAEELIQSQYWMVENFGKKVMPGFSQIFDVMNSDIDAITEHEIHRIAQVNLNHVKERGDFSMAILAVRPYPLALARLHKMLSVASSIRVEIFSDIDVAYKWLGISRPDCNIGDTTE